MSRSVSGHTQWSWVTGEKGCNRVRVFEHPKSRKLYLEWHEPVPGGRPRVRTESLGHTDRVEAKAAAEVRASFLRKEGALALPAREGPLLLHTLFEHYEEAMEQTGRLRPVHVRTRKRFLAWLGPLRTVASLDEHEVERYVYARTMGKVVLDGRKLPPVRARPIEEELTILRTVLRWAARRKTDSGRRLLPEMPILEWHIPKEENPRRPHLPEGEYALMLDHAWAINPRLWLALVVCHETGHRLNSVRQLKWADVNFESREITWRAEHQKNGARHVTPMTDTAAAAFERFRDNDLHTMLSGASADHWVFYGGKSGGALARPGFYHWWRDVRKAAGLAPCPGAAFHVFRRKLASELSTAPLAMVKAIGGWKHPHVVVAAYQSPTIEQQRAVMADRSKFASGTQ